MTGSEMTTAVVATAFGGPESLSVVETPLGEPGPGEVRVHVYAAGTNPIDYKLYSGALGQDPARLPMRLGLEAAGVITAVSDGAQGPGGIDAALDVVGTDEAIDTSVALVAQRDRIVTLAAPQRGFELGLKVLGGASGADPGTEVRATLTARSSFSPNP